jgi:transcriptional antiterminator Rof (Rho-off)
VTELVIKEMSERKKRKNNTIMFRVSEPTTNVKLDRINADLKVVKEIGAINLLQI